MWVVFVHCVVSLIAASMGNTLPTNDRSCVIDTNNLPGPRSWHWDEEGWQCSYLHPKDNVRRCIPVDWLCAGYEISGCGDGEDEGEICGGYGEDRTCTNPVTGEAVAWRCTSGSQLCISNDFLCDGYQDCGNGEDEGEMCGGYGEQDRTCTNPVTGEAVGWRCTSGSQSCIPNSKLCNGDQSCSDSEDEGKMCGGYGKQDRTCTNPMTGEALAWRCRSGSQRCIPNDDICDGYQDEDCDEGEDEGEMCGRYGEDRTCTNPITGVSALWRCTSGSQLCISNDYLCDGDQDCEDGEDESENCG